MIHPVILKRGEEERRGESKVGGYTCESIETGIRVEYMKDGADDMRGLSTNAVCILICIKRKGRSVWACP